jgi:hypothetical protein
MFASKPMSETHSDPWKERRRRRFFYVDYGHPGALRLPNVLTAIGNFNLKAPAYAEQLSPYLQIDGERQNQT